MKLIVFLLLVAVLVSAVADNDSVLILPDGADESQASLTGEADDSQVILIDEPPRHIPIIKPLSIDKASDDSKCSNGGFFEGSRKCLYKHLRAIIFPLMSDFYNFKCEHKITKSSRKIVRIPKSIQKKNVASYKIFREKDVELTTDIYTDADNIDILHINSEIAGSFIYDVSYNIEKFISESKSDKLKFVARIQYKFEKEKRNYLKLDMETNPHLAVTRGWSMVSLSTGGISEPKTVCHRINLQLHTTSLSTKTDDDVDDDDDESNSDKNDDDDDASPEITTLQFHGMNSQYQLGHFHPDPSYVASQNNDAKVITMLAKQATVNAPYYNFFEDNPKCYSANPKNQLTCGACYAFAAVGAMSARICQYSNGKMGAWLSPQDAISCNVFYDEKKKEVSDFPGCNGGSSYYVYDRIIGKKNSNNEETNQNALSYNSCHAYVAKDSTSGEKCVTNVCKDSVLFNVKDRVLVKLADKDMQWKSYKAEVRTYGPVTMTMTVYDDFTTYKGGIYKISSSCGTARGSHEFFCYGWGHDTVSDKDYYLCQNSWGVNWGEGGKFRIFRDQADIELNGYIYAHVEKYFCGDSKLSCNNGVYLKGCTSCRCFAGWGASGTDNEDCDKCVKKCNILGTTSRDDTSCKCRCKIGYSGDLCDQYLDLADSQEIDRVRVEWRISTKKPGDILAIVPASNSAPFTDGTQNFEFYSQPCGDDSKWSSSAICAGTEGESDSYSLDITGIASGEYNLFYIEYLGKNEFGADKGFDFTGLRGGHKFTVEDGRTSIIN